MKKKSSILWAIVLLLAYAAGLTLFIIGILSNGEKVLFTIIGLLICGLPTSIVTLSVSKVIYTGRNRAGKRFAIFFAGLLLGLVITPIFILYLLISSAASKPAQAAAAPQAPSEPTPSPFEETAASQDAPREAPQETHGDSEAE